MVDGVVAVVAVVIGVTEDTGLKAVSVFLLVLPSLSSLSAKITRSSSSGCSLLLLLLWCGYRRNIICAISICVSGLSGYHIAFG